MRLGHLINAIQLAHEPLLIGLGKAIEARIVLQHALLRLRWTGQLSAASGSVPLAVVGILATAYSLWAIIGAGAEAVGWGAVLLGLGVPLYFWFTRSSR